MAKSPRTRREHREADSESRIGCLAAGFVTFLALILAGVGFFSLWIVQHAVLIPYEGRIYPNVYVLGEDVGGLTPEAASEYLDRIFAHRDAGHLILTDGDQIWRIPWAEGGMRLDAPATAQQAFAAGREQGWRTLLSLWMGERIDLSAVLTVDEEATRQALEQVAELMYEPPTDAGLHFEGDQVVVTPSRQGRELDTDATAEKIIDTVRHLGPDYPFAPTFRPILPRVTDVRATQALAEEMLSREVRVIARGKHEGETFTWSWTLGREVIAPWLRVEAAEDPETSPPLVIRVDEEAIRATAEDLRVEPADDDWGFPTERVTQDVLDAFQAGGGEVTVDLTPPPRIYVVQLGEHLTLIAAKFGMPPGLIAEVNPGIDLNRLQIGQQLLIPPQDVLTPHDPVPGKEIVISIPEQRLRVYENGNLLHDWPCSTGKPESPTYTGAFQVLMKEEMAYASQWDLQMPHFIGVYRAGGDTYNGIHALPILSSGQRLWAGNLGSPVSYGCIILGIEEAETLYNWAEHGVSVIIE